MSKIFDFFIMESNKLSDCNSPTNIWRVTLLHEMRMKLGTAKLKYLIKKNIPGAVYIAINKISVNLVGNYASFKKFPELC